MKKTARLFFSCAAILALTVTAAAQERRTPIVGDTSGRDAVGFRKDSVTKETVGERRDRATTPTTAQAVEDFMQIQKANRQIQNTLKVQPLELEQIAASAKDLNKRANRLKISLTLPKPPKQENKAEIAVATTSDKLLSQIKELDANIKAFVTNPRFQQVRQADKDDSNQAKVAGENLQLVIEISYAIQRGAERLHQINRLEK